jgi:thymidylate synthase (FAD)
MRYRLNGIESVTWLQRNEVQMTTQADEIKGKYFQIHEHGFISLVDYMGSDEAIEQAARTSFGLGTRKTSDTRQLIRYLMRHKHTSPFEMVELKFHCAMPIFVARQWIRHRTANVNEYSGRYSLMPQLFYTPTPDDLCYQNKKNRQGRAEPVSSEQYDAQVIRWKNHRSQASAEYQEMVESDFALELARMDLPLSMYTYWYWKIDLHNLFHFLTLRVEGHAQKEIRDFGSVMAAMVRAVAPIAYEAWLDYQHLGARMSFQELQALRDLIADLVQQPNEESVLLERARRQGLSGRELDEFKAKILGGMKMVKEHGGFELDMTTLRDPSYFEKMVEDAAPKKKSP